MTLFGYIQIALSQSVTQAIATLPLCIVMPTLGAALITSRIALPTLLERTLGATVEAVDVATVALAANNNGLVAAATMVAPCSVLNGQRQSLPGSSGLMPGEVTYFNRLCENMVGDAVSG